MFTPSLSEEQHCEAVRRNMVSKSMELAGDLLYFGMNRIGALVFMAIISFSSIEYLKERKLPKEMAQYEPMGIGFSHLLNSTDRNLQGPYGENINLRRAERKGNSQIKTTPIAFLKRLASNLLEPTLKGLLKP